MAGRTSEAGASLLERATRLLGALPHDGSAATLQELATGSGLPVSTAHRIAAELVRLGLLERDAAGVYTAGSALWELGERAPIARRLREAASPELTELYDRTGENAHLGVLVGAGASSEVLYLAKASGARAIPTLSRVGVRHPLHATGVGRAILATFSADELEAFLTGPLERVTAFTIVDPGRLRDELAATRERGWAITRQEMTLGNASIAIPLAARRGLPAAAIGIVTHLAAADEQRLVPLLRRAVAATESRLA